MNSQIVTVNLIPGLSAPAVVKVSQYDYGRPILFKVLDGTMPASFVSGTVATVVGTKPSGLGFSEVAAISGNTASLNSTLAMTQEAGMIQAEVRFSIQYGPDIGTANFILAVEPSPHLDGTTDGTQETMSNLETRLQGQIDALDSRIDAIEGDQSIIDDIDALDARVTALEQGGSGLSQTEKNLILQLFSKAAYAESDASTAYDALEALWTVTTRTVTYNLSHVTSSNTASTVDGGSRYTTTLTATGNYTLNSVTVTMGGVDITSTAYSSGTITIPSVTGNIVITATAVLAAQSITATYTQSGAVYDTDSLDSLKDDLVVTANYSGGTSETVTDYTLSGTLTEGTSTITVSYAGLTDTFEVTVTTHPVLSGITANFNQGTAEISDTDNLSVLNQYLTVTADYTDGTHTRLTSNEYVLSGTLLDSVSTITVTYEEFSDTFTVNVSQTVIPAEAYKDDTTLTTFTSNAARTVMKDAFRGCTNLQSLSLPNVTEIKGGGNFRECRKLESVNLKSVTRIENSYAFGWAGNDGNGLTVVLPNITFLGAQTFGMATKMIAADIGSGLSELLNDTFYSTSSNLNTILILRRTAGVVAPRTADTIKCIKDLYVPSALVASYQTASIWTDRYNAGTITIHAIEGSQYENYYADGTAITT